MQNDLAVGGGLENRTFALELVSQNVRVNQIAVVRDRHLAADAIDHERLRVLDRTGAGGRIAGVSDGAAAFESHKNADRKSTRLNSSHPSISYAVFCLKKKKKTNTQR